MTHVIWFLVTTLTLAFAKKVDYTGFQVYKITPETQEQWQLLKFTENEAGVDFWRPSHGVGVPATVMLSPTLAPSILQQFQDGGLHVKLLHDDVQRLINAEAEQMKSTRRRKKRSTETLFDIDRYYNFAQIQSWLNNASRACGNLCKLESIGKSYEGRDLWQMQISSGSNRSIMYLECGIHAREWIAPAVCLNLINRLIFGYGTDRKASDMVDSYDWYIQASSNPDGYEYTHTDDRMWRKTRRPNTDVNSECVGTDPNRNFGHQWGSIGASSNPCASTYKGPRAFSEPETEAIRNYVTPIKHRIRAYWAVHSYGQYILIPWGYTPDYPPDYPDLEAIANAGAFAIFDSQWSIYTVGQSTRLLGATAGASDDWAKGDLGIKFAYTFELRDTGDFGFRLPENQIEGNSIEIFEAFYAMTEELRERFPTAK